MLFRLAIFSGAWYKPKSKASYRKIDIGLVTMSELKKWHIACPERS